MKPDTKRLLADISELTIEFMLYSFIGWLYEFIVTSIYLHQPVDRGILHLPICPIYGFFMLAVILTMSRIKNIPLLFILSSLLVSAMEYFFSWAFERFLNMSLWSYSHWPFNLNGRIALYSSLFFGVCCVLIVKLAHPFIKKLLDKLPKAALIASAGILLAMLLADTSITCINLFGRLK